MTDSPSKKPSEKRYHIASDYLDNTNTYVAPMTIDSDDEDAIDRLLMNTGFDVNNDEQPAPEADVFFEEQNFLGKYEVVPKFNIPKDIPKPAKTTETEATAPNEAAPVIEDSIDATVDFGTNVFEIDQKPEIKITTPRFQSTAEKVQDENIRVVNGAMPDALSQLLFHQESINRQHEALLKKLEGDLKKSSMLAYIAITLAVAAIAATAVITLTFYNQENTTGFKHITGELPGIHTADNSQPGNIADPAKIPLKSSWVVNLISFNQRSDAENQAEEYMKKGVRTEIIEVNINHEIWYRLRVGGFVSKEQAAAYADKVKAPLKLTTIEVAQY